MAAAAPPSPSPSPAPSPPPTPLASFLTLTWRNKLHFLFAAFLALFVWSVTPISWLYLGYDLALRGDKPRHWFSSVVFYYSLCEVPFSIYLLSLRREAQKLLPPPQVSVEALEELLHRCLGDHSHPSERDKSAEHQEEQRNLFRSRARRWFHHKPLEDIYADNAREWLGWAFGGRELDELRADTSKKGQENMALIEKGLGMLEGQLGHKFTPGYNPKARAMRLTLDPVKTLQRPFGYYVVCNSISEATIAWLRFVHGFRKEQHGLCDFLVLPPSSPKPQRDDPSLTANGHPANASIAARTRSTSHTSFGTQPILFLHGLGIGLGQYAVLLRRLVKHRGGVAILLQPNISVSIFSRRYFLHAPNKDEHVAAVRACLAAHHFEKSTILSHSNGTMVHGWVARDAPELAHRHVLVDPVCFRLWEGATSFAFLAKRWGTGIEILLGYFVAREVGVAYSIARRFLWWDMLLWADDLQTMASDRLQVVLGGNDVLIDVPAVLDYLSSAGVPDESVTVIPGAQHGQALFMPSEGMKVVCRHLQLEW